MDKIMVGDIIKIDCNNSKKSYSLFREWFKFYHVREENFEPELPTLEEHINAYDEDYTVRWIAPHLSYDVMLYAIEGIDTGRVFLVEREAIVGYYHTVNSSDCCYDINERLLAREVTRLRIENDILKQERDEEKGTKMEVKPKSVPMPPLENGWFGFIRRYDENGNLEKENDNEWFVVIKTKDKCNMIYQGGGVDEFVNGDYAPFCFENDGIVRDEDNIMMAEIVYLCKAISFDVAQYMYRNNCKTYLLDCEEIWRKA